ncbi:MAG TPA: cobalt transporter CbiM [Candidatus Angelobacter sp.]|jgi:cobalt/nickel transport system permease protein|nr:cobalt transporter CbiM [Candidatus Angelobacter sp.]
MHIPDGYLSPSTCALLYGGAGVGWYAALRRVKRTLNARMVPLIAVFAAFSFLVMMFNLPLPGGTTGHALGVTIAAIVLGPSGAIMAVSIAIAIQALFFGDGGITALGANCFNMAIAGSLVAYFTYRLIAANAGLSSRRRVVAAAIAGYLAVNVSALLAATEFGIQPILFHDANGTPLYAPYSLRIAIPAMMIGHLAIAGVAEALITGGLVAYLQSADPALLQNTSGLKLASQALQPASFASLRRLWIAVALLLLLTPLGILAAGTAWGEWTARDFSRPGARAQIAASSLNQAPPVSPPAGLQRLSTIWTAPIPSYAPQFIRGIAFGYLLSAMFGVGCVLAFSLLLQSYLRHRAAPGQTP